MNAVQPRQYIHYNPERTDYSVTPEELTQIESSGSNLWKDVCLVSAPLSISCLINAIANVPDPFKVSVSLFLNSLVGSIAVLATAVFGIAWHRTRTIQKSIFDKIKEKPKMEIIPNTTDIGAIPQTALQKPPVSGV